MRLTQVFKYLLEKVGNSEEEELAQVCMTSTWLTQIFRWENWTGHDLRQIMVDSYWSLHLRKYTERERFSRTGHDLRQIIVSKEAVSQRKQERWWNGSVKSRPPTWVQNCIFSGVGVGRRRRHTSCRNPLPCADELDNETSDKLMINVWEWRGC